MLEFQFKTVSSSITLIGSLVSNVRFRKCQSKTFRTDSLVWLSSQSLVIYEFYHEKKRLDRNHNRKKKKKLKDVARLGNVFSGKLHIVFAHIAHCTSWWLILKIIKLEERNVQILLHFTKAYYTSFRLLY